MINPFQANPSLRVVILVASLASCLPYVTEAQEGSSTHAMSSLAIPRFPIAEGRGISLSGPARPGAYLGVVGTRAAWLGFETGEGEVWAHPLKLARAISLSFKIPDYPEPIPGANVARRVEIRPELQTVAHSHAAFQVKEHIMAPRDRPGILILLEVDAVVDLEISVRFHPVLQYAWPGGFGGQYLYWDGEHRAFILSESLRTRNAIIGSPWATEASAHPAHRLAEAPSTFLIPVDRERAEREFIPLVIVGGAMPREEILALYHELMESAAGIYQENQAWARSLREDRLRLSVEGGSSSPGALFSLALEWAKVNLEEQRSCNPDLGCGLVAGWGPSGTSLRPGFGWYFGGDAAINSLAMDATGQWELVAEGLRFLAHYQREDGKIPHEISQAAATIPWFEAFPYAYYHADTTPFWMLALWHYWKASNDQEFLRELWPAFRKAYAWCLSVETDGDGIIENTTGGLGAIEVGGLGEGIHQDIYLAAVWIEALKGTARMATAMGEEGLAAEALEILGRATTTLNTRYWRPEEGHLAFGILRDGRTNDNLTAWPGTALSFGLLDDQQAEGTLRHLAADAISSSWGARLLSTQSDLFDPLHYNNGAVWPFMTGFVSWAQYRYRRPWAGYPLLTALHGLTFDFAAGRHPENLSGAYYETMDATVPHQFFATSMLVTPLARGLIGWEPDAPSASAVLAPQPPPTWKGFQVENLAVGESRLAMGYRRRAAGVEVRFDLTGPPVDLTYVQSIPLGARMIDLQGIEKLASEEVSENLHDQSYDLRLTLEEGTPVELTFSWEGGLEVAPPEHSLKLGARSGGLRVLDFTLQEGEWVLLLEGDGGSSLELSLLGEAVETADDASLVRAPTSGWTTCTIPFRGEGRVNRTLRLRPARR